MEDDMKGLNQFEFYVKKKSSEKERKKRRKGWEPLDTFGFSFLA